MKEQAGNISDTAKSKAELEEHRAWPEPQLLSPPAFRARLLKCCLYTPASPLYPQLATPHKEPLMVWPLASMPRGPVASSRTFVFLTSQLCLW